MKNTETMRKEMMELVGREIQELLNRDDLTEEGKLWWMAYQVFNVFDNGFANMPTFEITSVANPDGYEEGKVVSGFSDLWYDGYQKKAKEEGRELSTW